MAFLSLFLKAFKYLVLMGAIYLTCALSILIFPSLIVHLPELDFGLKYTFSIIHNVENQFFVKAIVIANFIAIYGLLFKYLNHHWSAKIIISTVFYYVFMYVSSYYAFKHSIALFLFALFPLTALGSFIFKNRKSTVLKTVSIFPKKTRKSNALGFVFKSKKQSIYLDNPFRGILVAGGAGSGKSDSFFSPIISQLGKLEYTGLLYDFKSPELTNKAIQVYKEADSSIKVYNVTFKQPEISHRLNPLHPTNITKSAFAFEYSQAIINNLLPETVKKNDFWGRNATNILAGVIWYMKSEFPAYCTLPHIISLILQTDIEQLLTKISKHPEAGGMIISLKQAIDRGAEKQVAGVLSTLQNALSRLNTADIFWILSGDDLTLDLNNPNNPKFLCVGNDSTLSETYTPAISLIISVATRLMNQPHKQQSVLMVDEAPTVYIPAIEQIPATARSNKIATLFGVQDYSQLKDKYGEDKAQVLLSNLGNQFYGRTTNIKSTEMIQKMFSKADKTYWQKSKGGGTSGEFIHMNSNKNNSRSQSIQERDRVKTTDITNLKAGEFYGIIAEGNVNELLKVQMNRVEIKETPLNHTLTVSTEEIHQNYLKIVQEAQTLFDTEEIKNTITKTSSSSNDYQISI